MHTPRERATVEVDSPRCTRATAANRRASNFVASRLLNPRCLGMPQPSWREPEFRFSTTGYGFTRLKAIVPGRSVVRAAQVTRMPLTLEVETEFAGDGARRDEVGSAECREEVKIGRASCRERV